MVLCTAYTPTADGSDGGYREPQRNGEHTGEQTDQRIFMISSITFAISSAAMSPQTIRPLGEHRRARRDVVQRQRPIITAVVPEPGTPSVSIGMKEPQAEVLFAARRRDAANIPLPKLSLLPLSFSRSYR